MLAGIRRELEKTLTQNFGRGGNAHPEGHDLLRVVYAGGETLTWCRKCSRYSRFRLERKLYNRFEPTLLNWNPSVQKGQHLKIEGERRQARRNKGSIIQDHYGGIFAWKIQERFAEGTSHKFERRFLQGRAILEQFWFQWQWRVCELEIRLVDSGEDSCYLTQVENTLIFLMTTILIRERQTSIDADDVHIDQRLTDVGGRWWHRVTDVSGRYWRPCGSQKDRRRWTQMTILDVTAMSMSRWTHTYYFLSTHYCKYWVFGWIQIDRGQNTRSVVFLWKNHDMSASLTVYPFRKRTFDPLDFILSEKKMERCTFGENRNIRRTYSWIIISSSVLLGIRV